jgi:hypothetical protein
MSELHGQTPVLKNGKWRLAGIAHFSSAEWLSILPQSMRTDMKPVLDFDRQPSVENRWPRSDHASPQKQARQSQKKYRGH